MPLPRTLPAPSTLTGIRCGLLGSSSGCTLVLMLFANGRVPPHRAFHAPRHLSTATCGIFGYGWFSGWFKPYLTLCNSCQMTYAAADDAVPTFFCITGLTGSTRRCCRWTVLFCLAARILVTPYTHLDTGRSTRNLTTPLLPATRRRFILPRPCGSCTGHSAAGTFRLLPGVTPQPVALLAPLLLVDSRTVTLSRCSAAWFYWLQHIQQPLPQFGHGPVPRFAVRRVFSLPDVFFP